jgi:transcriptional regulator GlxA family with amidase domain
VVVLVGYDGMQSLDLVGPAEVFSVADQAPGERVGYRLVIASPDGKPITTNSGLRLAADVALPEISGEVDTVLVAGGLTFDSPYEPTELADQLKGIAGRARRVGSVCTGTFILAAAGLLDGRSATTHWVRCAQLARRYPQINVEPDRIFVRDGNVYTSAGVTAGMDLALALVEQDHGAELARKVARMLVLFLQRPGGQSQFSARLAHPIPSGSALRPVLDAIVAEPAEDHRVTTLATAAGISDRHLTRLFLHQTGTTPARFVEQVRVEAARELLERTTLPVETVATRSGFGSYETMRRAFGRVIGIGPGDYRQRFRCTEMVS